MSTACAAAPMFSQFLHGVAMADIHELGVRYRAEGQEQVKQANRDVAQTGKQAETATRSLENAQKQREKADRSTATTARTVSTTTDDVTRATTGATRATQGMQRQTEQTTRAMVMLADETQDAAAAQRTLQANTTRASSAFSSFDLRGPMMQFSQIAQQATATGNVMQAVAIQAADIGMYFGAAGTAAGIAATLLIPMVANLWDTEAATKAAEKAQEEWQETLASAESHIANAESALRMLGENGLDTLTEKYGEVTEGVRELVRELASLEEEAAAREVSKLLSGLSSQISEGIEAVSGSVAGAMIQPMRQLQAEAEAVKRDIADTQAELLSMQSGTLPYDQTLERLHEMQEELAAIEGRYDDIGSLADEIGPDLEQIARVRGLLDALRAAEARRDFSAVAEIISEIRETAADVGIELETGMRRKMAEAEDTARQLVGRLGDAKDEADGIADSGIASTIGRASSEARALANWMGVSLEAAQKLASIGDWGIPGQGGRRGDPRDFGGGFLDWQTRDVARFDDLYQAAERGILDLIAVAEGTARGDGYNETLGYGDFTGGDVNLVNMTLNEVLELQRQMLAHPDNTFNSSAVGRYQIVSTTLRDLMARLDLSGNELFSGDMQDRLATELLRWRGANENTVRNTWEGARDLPSSLIQMGLGQQSIPTVDPELEREQTRATREAAQAERERSRELEASQQAVEGLAGSLDPLVAAEQRYADALDIVAEALEREQISQDEAAALREQLAAEYEETVEKIKEKQRDLAQQDLEPLRQSWSSLTDTLLGAARAGESVGEALRNWLLDAALQAALSNIVNSLTQMSAGTPLGGFLSWLGGGVTESANGNVFSGGDVVPFASGGVVASDTYFPMAGGKVGLMGEAGPEAIMPLTRGSDGKLGVKSSSSAANKVQVELVGGGLMLTDGGQVMTAVDARVVGGMETTVRATSRRFGDRASQYQERGT